MVGTAALKFVKCCCCCHCSLLARCRFCLVPRAVTARCPRLLLSLPRSPRSLLSLRSLLAQRARCSLPAFVTVADSLPALAAVAASLCALAAVVARSSRLLRLLLCMHRRIPILTLSPAHRSHRVPYLKGVHACACLNNLQWHADDFFEFSACHRYSSYNNSIPFFTYT
jgi:hypothetical protein